jgi:putative Mg2+ transporter-C (MgtC) family protein
MTIDPDSLNPSATVFWQHLGTAFLCGAAIGLERQLRGKVSGVRTSTLICVGTSLFVALGAVMAPERGDPTRVVGQVVTGIGFLGAGVILSRDGKILGVTTAAVIWVLAALGALIGAGYLQAAFVGTLVTILILVGVEGLENLWERRRGSRVSRELEGIDMTE